MQVGAALWERLGLFWQGNPDALRQCLSCIGQDGNAVLPPAILDRAGVFPAERGPADLESELYTDFSEHVNYPSVDEDDYAVQEFDRLARLGYAKTFTSLEACHAWLGEEPILNKLGLVTKEILRPDGTTKTKRRLILDCRRSDVNNKTSQNQRILLPRALDVAEDILSLLGRAEPSWGYEVLILDFRRFLRPASTPRGTALLHCPLVATRSDHLRCVHADTARQPQCASGLGPPRRCTGPPDPGRLTTSACPTANLRG